MPSVRQPGRDPSREIMNADKPFAVLKLIDESATYRPSGEMQGSQCSPMI